MLACLLVGGIVGSLLQSYHQYASEQRLMTEIHNRIPGSSMTVLTDGQELSRPAIEFM